MGDFSLVLREVRDEASETKTFLFDADGLAGAEAGQYLIFKLDVPADPRRGTRSFTMSNAPGERPVMLTTRIRSTSPFKQSLASMTPGAQIAAKGPFGKFTLHAGDSPALFLAGGIGVTPFRSIVKHALDAGRSIPMTLLTSDRTPEAIPFRETMDAWARARPTFRVFRTITKPGASQQPWPDRVGRIDAHWIREHMSRAKDTTVYVAGAPPFVADMRAALQEVGVADDRVRAEQFIGY